MPRTIHRHVSHRSLSRDLHLYGNMRLSLHQNFPRRFLRCSQCTDSLFFATLRMRNAWAVLRRTEPRLLDTIDVEMPWHYWDMPGLEELTPARCA